MSRGLGQNQRIILAALAALDGERDEGKWFRVAAVLNTAWERHLRAGHEAKQSTRREEREHRQEALEAAADAGDAAAAERLSIMRRMD